MRRALVEYGNKLSADLGTAARLEGLPGSHGGESTAAIGIGLGIQNCKFNSAANGCHLSAKIGRARSIGLQDPAIGSVCPVLRARLANNRRSVNIQTCG